jgi:hypothetical protein
MHVFLLTLREVMNNFERHGGVYIRSPLAFRIRLLVRARVDDDDDIESIFKRRTMRMKLDFSSFLPPFCSHLSLLSSSPRVYCNG